ncbi:baseplate J family protein [Acinetobacter qingfengensis]|uniref:Baseplate J family protein n=1 Tax=Acinetobacter qingfengensis TaxID=1262585 RepID=A0A1E7RC48_9GAMM|nr:baseplate J/gp47 family protein [Acinetobacter qingfengensis]KAA8734914.1 baseplate J family protein [Acinetobacter qingfengensis]OEY96918.1 baseplate J family protein [Acinetobacter qingfengensis]
MTAIDLSQLSPPEVVEQIDYETILAEIIQDYYDRMDALDIEYSTLRESDPAYKLAEVFAYREMLVRQRANESARAVLLAYSSSTDLDHKAAERNLSRRMITEATATTTAIMETDASLRQRVQLAPEGYTTAGSEGAYIFHGMNADVRVKDIEPYSPTPGIVSIYVLSTEGNGTAPEDLIDIVSSALNASEIRPLTDHVNVYSASIVHYNIVANIKIKDGPDADVILADATTTLKTYTDSIHSLGADVSISGIYQALHRPGVEYVDLVSPSGNISIASGQVGYCDSVTLKLIGED